MAHYDHRGGVGPHVRRQVESVAAAVDRLVVVSTADLTDESRAWLGERAELVERPNYGYDFTSYQVGLHRAGDLEAYDEVVICNDTYVPVTPYTVIFDAMGREPVDFWGLTRTERVATHVQSFFVAFRPWVVGVDDLPAVLDRPRPPVDATPGDHEARGRSQRRPARRRIPVGLVLPGDRLRQAAGPAPRAVVGGSPARHHS